MKRLIPVLLAALLLAACVPQATPAAPTGDRTQRKLTAQDEAMIEHCKLMPQMHGCEPYLAEEHEGEVAMPERVLPRDFAGYEDEHPAQLPRAQPTQVVTLADGDTYAILAQKVAKTISGRTLTMYGYNGMVPGPLLRVTQGSTVTITFTNQLDKPTTVHWHGLRLDNRFDGVPFSPNGIGTQDEVLPGETFTYEVTFPDDGIYWYHPHVREDAQQDLGLYGNLFVEPTEDPYAPADEEAILILDDILLDEEGVVPYGADAATHAIMGRFGNVLLVNGDTDYRLTVPQGSVVRFYLTNVANARPFRITIPGARMKLVGGDIGAYATERFVESVTIAPAERYIIDVLFDEPGAFAIRNEHPLKTYTLGTVTVTDETRTSQAATAFSTLRTNEALTADLERLAPYFDDEPAYTLELDSDIEGMMAGGMMGMMEEPHDGIEWEDTMPMMAAMTSDEVRWIIRDAASADENMDLQLTAAVGDVKKIRIRNPRTSMHPMQHPIHLHGQRFLVTNIDGEPVEDHVWKDTVLVPIGSTVDIVVEFTNPGTWMLHCHIAEHLTAGMMTSVEVSA